MQIIIAPAKKMRVATDDFAPTAKPEFLAQATTLLGCMQNLPLPEMQAIWQCSDKLARTAYATLQDTKLTGSLTPAIMAYVGIQYQSMAPELFTEPALAYVQKHLRILSGFYGVLRPFDGIVPYRLELQSKLPVNSAADLYRFWGSHLHDALDFTNGPVLNLASKEYSRAIATHLRPGEQLIDIVFGRLEQGRVKMRATRAKQARGAMVRFMAENNVQDLASLEQFDDPQYRFAPQLSSDKQLVFLENA
jgi:cytoplasmic iron level regulating protein YaaA (DUF328/UPF0246 family)